MNFSFAGCGFLGIYHVGVASCLRAHAPHLLENSKIGGASAGAMAATCLLTGCPLGDCTSYVLKIATKARSRSLGPLHPSFNIVKIIRDGMREILPKDAYKMASGRLFISMTRVSDRQSVVVSEYESNDDLVQVLLCSAFVPFYAGLFPPSYKGVRYVDGGLSDNMPSLGEDTIFVSPFAGESDICPDDDSANFHHVYLANTSVQCTIQNLYRFSRALFPPHPEILSAMCKQGFDDTLKYLQTNDLLSCVRHISVQSTLVPYEADDAANDEATSDYDSCDETDDIQEHGKLGFAGPCSDCSRIQQLALIDTLPPVVVEVLQATCDSMKSSFWSWIYYSKFFHAISLASTPLILPLDILIVYSERFINWIPYLPNDVRWTADSFLYAIKEAIAFINHKRHKYSARLTCELAISDLDLSHASHVPGEGYSNHFKVSTHDVQSFTSCSTVHRIDLNRLRVNTGEDDQGRMRVHSRGPSPLTCLSHIRQHIIEDDDFEKIEVRATSANNVDVHAEIRNPKVTGHDSWTNEVVDTFEHTLEAANHMDSVLSYYYKENGDNVKFTEIFSVRPDGQDMLGASGLGRSVQLSVLPLEIGNSLEEDDTEICRINKV